MSTKQDSNLHPLGVWQSAFTFRPPALYDLVTA